MPKPSGPSRRAARRTAPARLRRAMIARASWAPELVHSRPRRAVTSLEGGGSIGSQATGRRDAREAIVLRDAQNCRLDRDRRGAERRGGLLSARHRRGHRRRPGGIGVALAQRRTRRWRPRESVAAALARSLPPAPPHP